MSNNCFKPDCTNNECWEILGKEPDLGCTSCDKHLSEGVLLVIETEGVAATVRPYPDYGPGADGAIAEIKQQQDQDKH